MKMMIRNIVWWLPLPVIGTLNGIIRGFLLNRFYLDHGARQFSSVLMIIWILIYIKIIYGKLHLQNSRDAWVTGISWLVLTVVFEFGVGHFISGSSLDFMLADYNLFAGRFWPLVLVSILLGPILYFKFGEHGSAVTPGKNVT